MPLWVFFVILTLTSGSHCSLPASLPFRMRRYADAIFTNSYRKVLGQLSARKLLQDIMSRQQGGEEPGARNQSTAGPAGGQHVGGPQAGGAGEPLGSPAAETQQGFPRMKPSAEAWPTCSPNNWTQLLSL
ncbi:Ghrh [Lemmus lemmus]